MLDAEEWRANGVAREAGGAPVRDSRKGTLRHTQSNKPSTLRPLTSIELTDETHKSLLFTQAMGLHVDGRREL